MHVIDHQPYRALTRDLHQDPFGLLAGSVLGSEPEPRAQIDDRHHLGPMIRDTGQTIRRMRQKCERERRHDLADLTDLERVPHRPDGERRPGSCARFGAIAWR